MGEPLVSVVMAVQGEAPFLADAMDSILAQANVDFEFVLVDDGIGDAARPILDGRRDRRLVIVENGGNRGLTAALNVGLKKARGRFVARMDADDVALPGRLRAQADALQATGAEICFCRCIVREESSGKETPWHEMAWPLAAWRGLFSNYYGVHPAVMFDRRAVLGAGGYDEVFRRGQDYELWDRCLASGMHITYVPKVHLVYRRHSAMISRRHAAEQFETGRIVSLRALGRTFPDASEDELKGLHWLMLNVADFTPDQSQLGRAIAGCFERVAQYVNGMPAHAAAAIWRDVAGQLTKRLSQIPSPVKGRAARLMLRAGVHARSPVRLAQGTFAMLASAKPARP